MVFHAAAKIKMHNAAFQMTVTSSNQQRYKISSRSYALLKRNKSMAMKGNTYGSKPMSDETKRKISNAKKGVSVNKGKLISIEQKEKLSIALKGRIPWNKGKTYSHKK
jgi:predicted RNase H-like nuclease (RuvC/YqgF family)